VVGDVTTASVRVPRSFRLALCVALVASLGACGDDDEGATTEVSTSAVAETTASPPTSASASTVVGTTKTVEVTTTTTAQAGLEQPAIWPAADVVFGTPEAAAEDFVAQALGVPPTLGEFQQGDSRSGEIEVFSPGEGDAGRAVVRGLLLLRQLGPEDGWFVLVAVNDNASITMPGSGEQVAAGPVTVEGVARGFEANVVVTALVAGTAGPGLDQQVTMGGAAETPEPFSVTLDLSRAAPGDMVMLLVRGGAGLETDPGDFGAIPVVVK
jgi:Immunoglobulin-like domain of bacterial spore germination